MHVTACYCIIENDFEYNWFQVHVQCMHQVWRSVDVGIAESHYPQKMQDVTVSTAGKFLMYKNVEVLNDNTMHSMQLVNGSFYSVFIETTGQTDWLASKKCKAKFSLFFSCFIKRRLYKHNPGTMLPTKMTDRSETAENIERIVFVNDCFLMCLWEPNLFQIFFAIDRQLENAFRKFR